MMMHAHSYEKKSSLVINDVRIDVPMQINGLIRLASDAILHDRPLYGVLHDHPQIRNMCAC